MRGDAGRGAEVGWGRVGSGGGGGHIDVNSMSGMQKLLASTAFLLICVGEARSTIAFFLVGS